MTAETLLSALHSLAKTSSRPVVLIDGGAGSGKTTLARFAAEHWPGGGPVELVGLDEVYPGWTGLATGSAAVPALISGTDFQTWDWLASRPGHWRRLDPSRPLIVEGCGAITRTSKPLTGLAIWLELDPDTRQERALARDGATFAEHWDEWAVQEAEHWRVNRPWELADLVLPGA